MASGPPFDLQVVKDSMRGRSIELDDKFLLEYDNLMKDIVKMSLAELTMDVAGTKTGDDGKQQQRRRCQLPLGPTMASFRWYGVTTLPPCCDRSAPSSGRENHFGGRTSVSKQHVKMVG